MSYLPPDTFEIEVPYVAKCRVGEREIILSAVRDFRNGHPVDPVQRRKMEVMFSAAIIVGYSDMEPVILSTASADRYNAATINGHPAVIVRPVTPEGWGEGRVVFRRDDGGVVDIFGNNIPLEELLKIAEGVRCASC